MSQKKAKYDILSTEQICSVESISYLAFFCDIHFYFLRSERRLPTHLSLSVNHLVPWWHSPHRYFQLQLLRLQPSPRTACFGFCCGSFEENKVCFAAHIEPQICYNIAVLSRKEGMTIVRLCCYSTNRIISRHSSGSSSNKRNLPCTSTFKLSRHPEINSRGDFCNFLRGC